MMTIVYVLVDDEQLQYYNELMKSLYTLRYHMPERNVCVLTDGQTYEYIKTLEIMEWADVKPVEVPSELTFVEKSRYLKIKARQYIDGDMLYIDTDTVIAQPFSDILSDKSLGAVLDLNRIRSSSMECNRISHVSGLKLNNYKALHNGGVLWSRDDSYARKFYEEWFELWNQTRQTGYPQDQASFNYLFEAYADHVFTLGNEWNVMIGAMSFTPLQYLYNANIIHYLHNKEAAYKLCSPYYYKMSYNEEEMKKMLLEPYNAFHKCLVLKTNEETNLFELDEYYQLKNTHLYHMLYRLRKKHNRMFTNIEKIISFIVDHRK